MRVFVSEFVCGGSWPGGRPEGSLQTEGAAMLLAAVDDFARISDACVVTTWDARLGPFPLSRPNVAVAVARSADDEAALFDRFAAECDATLAIAPEFHGLLSGRSARAPLIGGTLLGPSPELIRLCGDKLALADCLSSVGVPVIPTRPIPAGEARRDLPFPVVVKPRHGAGSVNTFLAKNSGELDAALAGPHDPPDLPPDVWQPFVVGRALSVAVLDGEPFPVAEQRLSGDGRFRYEGGVVPARDVPVASIHALVRSALDVLGAAARGYLGFDVIVPHVSAEPILVEINPRMTTSYLGYRRLCEDNLAARLLAGATGRPHGLPPLRWRHNARVAFHPDGTPADD